MTQQTQSAEEKARLKKQWTELAIQQALASQWEEAVTTNRNILNLFPNEAEAYNRLGKAYSELGQYTEARQAYSQTLKYSPNNTIARKNLDRLSLLQEAPALALGGSERIDPRLFIDDPKALIGYLTPRFGYHFTRYNLKENSAEFQEASRALPISSIDAGVYFDRPFQWGSKRTGPDLARVGGKYSDDWHRDHLRQPKSVVPGTVMPAYPWLEATDLDYAHIDDDMKVNAALGVPYTPEMIQQARADVKTQSATDAPEAAALVKRYPRSQARDYDGNPGRVTEADALIAYLQVLGTLVDFKLYDDKANIR